VAALALAPAVPNDPSDDAEASPPFGGEDEVAQLRQLIRMIGHEIGNSLGPIGSLLGSARTIVARQADEPADAAEVSDRVDTETTARAARAPAEVLALARLDLVLRTAAERAGHLQSFLQECVRLTRLPDPRPTAADWGAIAGRLRVLWPGLVVEVPDLRRATSFDVALIEQVLVNLVKNAYEAGGPPDEVRVRIEPASSGPGPGAGTTVTVLDRGRGASDVQLEAMARGGFTTKVAGGGVGLGVCRALVERHGGRLRLERRSGGGMAASFWLPDPRRR